jgi:hypothetical protein
MVKSVVARERVPDVSPDQQTLDLTRKLLRKLRWIGREEDAEQIIKRLDDAGLRSPTPGDRRCRL